MRGRFNTIDPTFYYYFSPFNVARSSVLGSDVAIASMALTISQTTASTSGTADPSH